VLLVKHVSIEPCFNSVAHPSSVLFHNNTSVVFKQTYKVDLISSDMF
jgi:hypothetical protein